MSKSKLDYLKKYLREDANANDEKPKKRKKSKIIASQTKVANVTTLKLRDEDDQMPAPHNRRRGAHIEMDDGVDGLLPEAEDSSAEENQAEIEALWQGAASGGDTISEKDEKLLKEYVAEKKRAREKYRDDEVKIDDSLEPKEPHESAASSSSATQADSPSKTCDVVYRDKEGKLIAREQWLAMQIRAAKKSGSKSSREPQNLSWSEGLVQKDEKKKREEEERAIAAQPVARYDIDQSFDAELRQKESWDDPMRNYQDDVEVGDGSTQGDANRSNRKEVSRKPKSRFLAPTNRFGIQPGYRWDGVIRGNGFEERSLKEKNRQKFEKQEAYKWSIEDM